MYGDISKLESTMNHHFLNQLTLASDEITQEPRTIDKLNNLVQDGKYTHVLVPDEHFHILNGSLENCLVPVVELLGDHWIPWAIDRKRDYLISNGIREVIVFTDRFLEQYKNLANFHAVHYGYNQDIFIDKKNQRDIDILIHGSLGEDTHKSVYPVRNFLAEFLSELGKKEGLNVEKLKHPGYWPKKEEKPANGFISHYSEVLNRSKIAIGGSSHWRLPLKKFYEVTASGAILLSDLPIDERDFFEGKIIEIDSNSISAATYKDEIKRNILNVLENYEKSKERLQPFRNEQDLFDKSYEGRAIEIRAVLASI